MTELTQISIALGKMQASLLWATVLLEASVDDLPDCDTRSSINAVLPMMREALKISDDKESTP